MSLDTVATIRRPGPASRPAGPALRQTFVVGLEHGLHARPCALLIKTARRFHADVLVEAHGARASAHSILGLLALAAGRGSPVTFSITGPEAAPAMAAISHLFETGFLEAYGAPPVPARA